jgi:hypothetical protein
MVIGHCLICGKEIKYGERYSLSIEGKKHLRCAEYLTEAEKKALDKKK